MELGFRIGFWELVSGIGIGKWEVELRILRLGIGSGDRKGDSGLDICIGNRDMGFGILGLRIKIED